MSSPIKSGGDLSRRVQKHTTGAAASSAVITLELLNFFTAITSGILNYAFSHPMRMYEVGVWFVGVPTFIAFLQGSFYIGGSPWISPVVMFVFVGMTVVMQSHRSVIAEIGSSRHNQSPEFQSLCLEGLVAEITAMTLFLWGLSALALWWSPDTSTIYQWFDVAKPDKITRERYYALCVLLIVMIVMCNESLHFLLRRRVRDYWAHHKKSLPASWEVYTDAMRTWQLAGIDDDEQKMYQGLKQIKSQYSTPVLLGVTTIITGIYYLSIGPFHGVNVGFFW